MSRALALLFLSTTALAERPSPDVEMAVMRDFRADTDDLLVLPEGTFTATPRLRLVTARGGLLDRPIEFSDLMLVDLEARGSLFGRADVYGGATLMPKQPTGNRDLLWQGASLGVRTGLGGRDEAFGARSSGPRVALDLSGRLAPLASHQGLFSSADLLGEVKAFLDSSLFVRGAVGGSYSTAWWRSGARSGFGEVVVGGEVAFVVRRAFSAWAGAELRLPFAASGTDAFTPTTRLNAKVGVAATYVRDWDLFAELQIIDRGDLAVPGTTLPLIDGGFDQVLLVVGLTRRVELPRSAKP